MPCPAPSALTSPTRPERLDFVSHGSHPILSLMSFGLGPVSVAALEAGPDSSAERGVPRVGRVGVEQGVDRLVFGLFRRRRPESAVSSDTSESSSGSGSAPIASASVLLFTLTQPLSGVDARFDGAPRAFSTAATLPSRRATATRISMSPAPTARPTASNQPVGIRMAQLVLGDAPAADLNLIGDRQRLPVRRLTVGGRIYPGWRRKGPAAVCPLASDHVSEKTLKETQLAADRFRIEDVEAFDIVEKMHLRKLLRGDRLTCPPSE